MNSYCKLTNMHRCAFVATGLFTVIISSGQERPKLTVEKIMRDPKWIGTSPSGAFWSEDSRYLYFNWNPDNAPSDSTYFISVTNHIPAKASAIQKQGAIDDRGVT